MSSEANDYRQLMRERLSERRAHNPLYSLRAFARDLSVSAPQLSLVLAGKKGLSVAKAKRIAKALGMREREAEHFRTLIECEHARSKAARTAARARLAQLSVPENSVRLQQDAFRTVSDWYHFAILQLMRLAEWREDLQWIASRLGINEQEVPMALGRLERLELIQRSAKTGKLVLVSETLFTTDGVPSDALRKFHKQVLDKAAQALVEQPLERRYFNSTIAAVAVKDIPRAKARIKDFHQSFMNEFSENPASDRVYCLAVQLFDLTQEN
jgi:uncharacterized protein (TIGR02147 family)